ncbi:MAG TPA: sugar transferase [Nocardioides sp.]|jgi:exopolysaccharide biosynthesis polyprenyl glycosylphosphotransferase|nr:sugar transferase [Nocardioides sp.]HEX3297367.1 sugar transferase [Nocardioides sp.]
MSTHVEVRLPIVEVAVSDLVAAGGLPIDLPIDNGATNPLAGVETHVRRPGFLGLRAASVETLVRLGADVLALGLAIALVQPTPTAAHAFLWISVVLASFAVAGLYDHRLRLSALDDVPAILIGSAIGLAAMAWAHGPVFSKAVLEAALLGTLVVLCRGGAYLMLRRLRCSGVLRRETVLVGTRSRAAELVARIEQHPETGLRVRGVLGVRPSGLEGLPITGDVADLPDLIASGAVDTVIVGDASSKEECRVIEALRSCGTATEIFVLPRLSELSTAGDDEVWGVPLHRLKQYRSRTRMAVKRAADVTIASAALLTVAPLIGLAALAVRLEMGPGVIYRQERVGLGGRRFQLLKLRSMRSAESGGASGWATDADRVGRVGAFIRRYSIDELPQLVNVLRGDMSLVGPRPERPEYVDQFGNEFPSYAFRHRVMVGLTGLAAVEGLRGDTSIADRAYFDNWYIEHWSLWLDVKIMVRTASALLKGTGAG